MKTTSKEQRVKKIIKLVTRYSLLATGYWLLATGYWLLATFLATGSIAYAFGTNGCEGDCKKCHSLSTQEVGGILKKMNLSHAKILNIQLSPVKSLWEIHIDDNGKKGIFYVDFSKKYLIAGTIVEVATGSNKTAESAQKIPIGKADVSKIPINNALVMGNNLAPKRVIVFTDPD